VAHFVNLFRTIENLPPATTTQLYRNHLIEGDYSSMSLAERQSFIAQDHILSDTAVLEGATVIVVDVFDIPETRSLPAWIEATAASAGLRKWHCHFGCDRTSLKDSPNAPNGARGCEWLPSQYLTYLLFSCILLSMTSSSADKAPAMLNITVGEDDDKLVLDIPEATLWGLEPTRKKEVVGALSRFVVGLAGNGELTVADIETVLTLDGTLLTMPGSAGPVMICEFFGDTMISDPAEDIAAIQNAQPE
jgi:hypothetical protein